MGREFTAAGSYKQTYPQKLGRGFCGTNIDDLIGSKTGDKWGNERVSFGRFLMKFRKRGLM
jgi:hypothetical protein